MCKIRYRKSIHLKVLVSSFYSRGCRPLSDFVQELKNKMLRRVYSRYDAGGLKEYKKNLQRPYFPALKSVIFP